MIRPASRADLTEIAAIEAESFSEPWSLALLEDSFENPLDFSGSSPMKQTAASAAT